MPLIDTIFFFFLRLPLWTHSVYPGLDMKEITDYSYKLSTYTPELAKLRNGFLLKDILDRSLDKSHNKLEPNRSVWMYSGHETTIINMLNSLGLYSVSIRNLYALNTIIYYYLMNLFIMFLGRGTTVCFMLII